MLTCRLCGGATEYRFTRKILRESIDCRYHECTTCRALQTDTPTWLDRSYGPEFHELGIGSANRSVWCQALVTYLAKVLCLRGNKKILDFGGGVGLLTRLLRDVGHDAWIHDTYSPNIFAAGFEGDPDTPYSMVTTFEVFEHFADPLADAGRVFDSRPDFVVVGTGLYCGQGSDWYYLFPNHGQHVFFWSVGAHHWLANQLGYHVVTVGQRITVYSREKVGPVRRSLARACEIGAKLTQVLLPLAGRPGLARDELRAPQAMFGVPVDSATATKEPEPTTPVSP